MSLPVVQAGSLGRRAAPIDAAAHLASLAGGLAPSLYLHVPFCRHKCHYCDFYSITRQNESRMERFVDLLLREADLWLAHFGPTAPRTIFFGGGTPTLLPLAAMRRLLQGVRDRFDLSQLSEWTIEVNPATADLEYCAMLRGFGVDRLSFGAQSFNPAELALLERSHAPGDVERGLAIARAAGFSRLNVDLIFGIPGQDVASWQATLEQAIALRTPHLSCYNLTYEPNTPMAVRKRLGQFQAVEEAVELEMLHLTRQRLADKGFAAYEISNFAQPNEACRHNLVYWTGGNYIGLGPAAASHVDGRRWRNRPHLGEWEQALEASQLPLCDFEILTPPRRAGELAMLMLRLGSGLNFADFSARTGQNARDVFADPIERFSRVGLLRVDSEAIRLTEAGLSVADAIASEFLSPLEAD